jgi:SAM-dependent methyltransferase
MHPSHIPLLVCPREQGALTLVDAVYDGDYVRSGLLQASSGRSYPIREFIPRFTDEGYAKNFTVEWEKHPTILHESMSRSTLYRKRFAEETRWPDNLDGELVLEAGCGPGALTPYPLERGATVVSLDLSSSVDQARRIIGPNVRSLFVQASLFEMPFRPGAFDRCFCFGVVQHTPNPQSAMSELVRVLRPEGHIAVDSYVIPDKTAGGGHRLLRAKYRFRRLGLHRLHPNALHMLVRAYVALLFPIHHRISNTPRRVEFMRALMFDDYQQRLAGMDEKRFREFAALDIFDFLSPAYDFPQTVASFRRMFEECGLARIDVHPGYNGLEGCAVKPAEM